MTQNTNSPTPDPHTRRRLTLLTSVAAIALIALGAVGAQLPALTTGAEAATVAPAVQTAANPSTGFANLIAAVRPAVVSVRVQLQQPVSMTNNGNDGGSALPFNPFGPFGMPNMPRAPHRQLVIGEGSGFFISPDGYIVTANHVVANATKVQVTTSSGKVYKAHVVGTDPGTDLAVIKVDNGGNNFTYVKFANKMPRVGDWVVAIGNPFGLGNTATAGIVSARRRNINMSTYDNYLQIDAPINRGNSGGPTFDMKGQVVGINDAIYTPSGGSVGIGFDVPASIAKTVVQQLISHGHVTRGWIGVQVQPVTQPIADSLGMKQAEGALVAQPEPGSPATKAGIKAGDVITAINGTTVKNPRDLAQAVGAMAPGTSVKLDVLRNGKSKTITLALGTLPQPQQNPPA